MTKEQEKAVEYLFHSNNSKQMGLQLIASAGSGKTFTITKTVEKSRQYLDMQKIALITFTKKSANEMKHRLEKLENEIGFIGTIHALGYKILKDFYGKDIQIITDSSETIKNIILNKYPQYRYIPSEFLGLNNHILPADIQNDVEKQYTAYKKERDLYDFDDIVISATKILKECNSNLYDLIFVDEFQDTSYEQIDFIKQLNPNKLFVVGDSKQSIYSFRGAVVEIFYDLVNYFPFIHRTFLTYNFRSQAQIVNMSNRFIQSSSEKFAKNMRPTIAKKKKPVLYHVKYFYSIEESFLLFYKHFDKSKSITVLVRTNYIKYILESFIQKNNILNVDVMTVHNSKGLEFDYVLIFGVVLDIFPHKLGNLPEEIRLFYVAITRAKVGLYFISWESSQSNSKQPFTKYGQEQFAKGDSVFLKFLIRQCRIKYL